MDELELPPMVVNNEDPKGTAFSVSVDATREHGKLLLVLLHVLSSSHIVLFLSQLSLLA